MTDTRYLPSLLVPLFGLAQWLIEKFADTHGFFDHVPWSWILVVWVSFTAGVFISDIRDPGSSVRQWWRRLRACFVIVDVVPAYKNTPAGREWLEITVHLRFIRRLRNARLVLRVSANINLPHATQHFVLLSEQLKHVERDHTQNFVVAVVTIKEPPGVAVQYPRWGSAAGAHPLHADTDNIVAIEVDAGWRYRQRELVFLAGLNLAAGAFGRVFIARSGSPASLAIAPL